MVKPGTVRFGERRAHSGGQRLDQRGDRQSGQIDLARPHYLQQPTGLTFLQMVPATAAGHRLPSEAFLGRSR